MPPRSRTTSASSGSCGGSTPDAATTVQPRAGAAAARRGEPERGPQLAEHLRQRARAGERTGQCGEGLGFRPSPARLEPAAADPVDEHGHHARRYDEHDQRQEVLAFADRSS